MSRAVWKYELATTIGKFPVELPRGAQIVDVGTQQNHAYMWAIVDPEAPVEQRWFQVIGTGSEIDGALYALYVDTFSQGAHVWHLFEVRGPR